MPLSKSEKQLVTAGAFVGGFLLFFRGFDVIRAAVGAGSLESTTPRDPTLFASPHFKWSELTVSGSHPTLARKAATSWTKSTRANVINLLNSVVEPLRSTLKVPFKVLSCFRPIFLNDAVGSSRSSQHIPAQAMDFVPTQNRAQNFKKAWEWCLANRSKFGQAIFYWGDPRRGDWSRVGFVHISTPGRRKGQMLYKQKGGKYIVVKQSIK